MMLDTDYVWNVLVENLPRSKNRGRFIDICCPMCVSRGESQDTRFRCGIIRNTDSGFGVSCFNCGFKAKYVMGGPLGKNSMDFLDALGVSDRKMLEVNYMVNLARSHFNRGVELGEVDPRDTGMVQLPKGARPIQDLLEEGCDNKDFLDVCQYLLSRGDYIARSYKYYWSPEKAHKINRRIIIPFIEYGDFSVGWTGRLIDPSKDEKYYTKGPKSYLFNSQVLRDKDIHHVILNEGPFDAIADNGVSALGSNLNQYLIDTLKESGKRIIVIPDPDKAGSKLIDIAIQNGFSVSFPNLHGIYKDKSWWEPDVKDPAQACKRYGHLYTLRSIIESSTNNVHDILVKRKFVYQKDETKSEKVNAK